MITFTKLQNDILQKAIDTYGEQMQIDVAIEEMAELTKALIKERRETKNNAKAIVDICEEIADVAIMLEQLMMIFDFQLDDDNTSVSDFVKHKINRLESRLNKQIFFENNVAYSNIIE